MPTTITEPTPSQLALISSLEARAKPAFEEFRKVAEAVRAGDEELRAAGNPGALFGASCLDHDALHDLEKDVAELHVMTVTGGRAGFLWWYVARARDRESLAELAGDIDGRELRAVMAVEEAIGKVDPWIVEQLQRLDDGIEPEVMLADAGVTKDQFGARADVAITKVIESGWRP